MSGVNFVVCHFFESMILPKLSCIHDHAVPHCPKMCLPNILKFLSVVLQLHEFADQAVDEYYSTFTCVHLMCTRNSITYTPVSCLCVCVKCVKYYSNNVMIVLTLVLVISVPLYICDTY